MNRYFFLFSFFFLFLSFQNSISLFATNLDSTAINLSENNDKLINENTEYLETNEVKIITNRLQQLNNISSINYSYNKTVQSFIDAYLIKNKQLISRMLSLSNYYFPIFEQTLDKYDLPLELKYLSIVESALNPNARSKSGARGLWQFMYPTGKQYGLEVNSYIDERNDPFKSTEAACQYFVKLYDIFGDWNLVLAAYNGGPGYIQRKLISTGKDNFWDLRPFLRRETRNYIPSFVAVSYLMTYANEYNIRPDTLQIKLVPTDTFTINCQISFSLLSTITCVPIYEIKHLNPSYKNDIFPLYSKINLPLEHVNDYLLNYESNKVFVSAVNNKEILIDEIRHVYIAEDGDYLGKIASKYKLKVFQIKKWNRLKSSKLKIGDKLILYVSTSVLEDINRIEASELEYIVRKGDTLWEISQMYDGVSITKIKQLNKLKSNNLKPGSRILIPKA
jgi:membrane-bound lytic murein transglycosylase D|tara:strand:- start:1151 stop:2497 length:1347 start_codon:yes stop_codon:yes gene_type:complete